MQEINFEGSAGTFIGDGIFEKYLYDCYGNCEMTAKICLKCLPKSNAT